jgi:hypothetical protein
MSSTVALLVLLTGVVIGYHLQALVARLRARYRRATYKPAVLRRLALDLDPDQEVKES